MNHRSLVFIAIVGLTGAGALSCASQSAATQPPAPPSEAAPAPAQPAEAAPAPASPQQATGTPPAAVAPTIELAWKDLPKEKRGKYMASVVVPRMREVFRAFDPKEFAEFGCKTCHGKSARDRGFSMPTPDLPVLPSSHEEFGAIMKEKPEWVKFMSEKVTPEMATLLGLKTFDPKTQQPGTFSCANCHTAKGQ